MRDECSIGVIVVVLVRCDDVGDVDSDRAELPAHRLSGDAEKWYAGYIVARERGKTPDEAFKDAARDIERTRS